MKNTKSRAYHNEPVYTHRRPYPNAADPRYFADRAVDALLSAVTGMGALTILIFLITL